MRMYQTLTQWQLAAYFHRKGKANVKDLFKQKQKPKSGCFEEQLIIRLSTEVLICTVVIVESVVKILYLY
jgi:hypothetical protein